MPDLLLVDQPAPHVRQLTLNRPEQLTFGSVVALGRVGRPDDAAGEEVPCAART